MQSEDFEDQTLLNMKIVGGGSAVFCYILPSAECPSEYCLITKNSNSSIKQYYIFMVSISSFLV
uniref:Uncharacterized protein n=1 Tax=Lepeophtheirus salmonis TaxID=72036 RepID=A0A0K2UVV1_LEPSM